MAETEKFKAFLEWRNEKLKAFQDHLVQEELWRDVAVDIYNKERAKLASLKEERAGKEAVDEQRGHVAGAKMGAFLAKVAYLRAADNYEIAQSYFGLIHFKIEQDGKE